MNLPLFVHSLHCLSEAHCRTCRSLRDGRQWRRSIMRRFAVPDNDVDFSCPYGKPMRNTRFSRQKGEGSSRKQLQSRQHQSRWPEAITAAPDLVERIKICESNQCGQFIRRCCGSGAPGCRALDPYADSGDVEPGERRDANPRKLYAAITRNGCPLGHFGKRRHADVASSSARKVTNA